MNRTLLSAFAGAVVLLTANVAAAAEPALADSRKNDIEGPTRGVVARAADANPKVEPGKVVWHPSFADACTASQKSGKPVFLFQMMGKLDDRFC